MKVCPLIVGLHVFIELLIMIGIPMGWALPAMLGQRSEPRWVWAKPKSYVRVVDTRGPVWDILSLKSSTCYYVLSFTVGGMGRYVILLYWLLVY